jgi:hypothetical protein
MTATILCLLPPAPCSRRCNASLTLSTPTTVHGKRQPTPLLASPFDQSTPVLVLVVVFKFIFSSSHLLCNLGDDDDAPPSQLLHLRISKLSSFSLVTMVNVSLEVRSVAHLRSIQFRICASELIFMGG